MQKKIRIFASSELKPDLKTRAIMTYLQSSFSHVGIIIDDVIYHAVGEGVEKVTVSEFLKTHRFEFDIDVTGYIKDFSFAHGWCEGSLGKDYSESNLMGIVLRPLRRFNYFNDGREEMICSEYCAMFLDECSTIPIFDEIDTDFITPVQFIEALLNFLNSDVD